MKFQKSSVTALLSSVAAAIMTAATLSATPASQEKLPCNVLSIGIHDGKPDEFALSGKSYAEVPKNFPYSSAVYNFGESGPDDIPFVIPGPDDGWAGAVKGTVLIRFRLDGLPDRHKKSDMMTLSVNLVETHPSHIPELEIRLNGYKVQKMVPGGRNSAYLDDFKPAAKNLSLKVSLPLEALKDGENELCIRSVAGSWLVLDNISLDSPVPVRALRPEPGLSFMETASLPALVKGDSGLMHPVRFMIANAGGQTEAEWHYGNDRRGGTVSLAPGINILELDIPEGYADKKVRFTFTTANFQSSADVIIREPEDLTVYLVQHTHTDIGYTKPQTEILTEHLRYIDYAVEYCEATENYPDDSKFRWTCEASWAVREWLKIRPESQVRKFLHYVKEGRIEVTAMFFNMSEISGENNYRAFLRPVSEFHSLGIPVVTAMQNDVCGIAWCLADYLPDLGVKYMTIGSNSHRSDIPFDCPTLYRWESPSGKSLLAYRSDHYNTGNAWGIHSGDLNSVENGLFAYVDDIRSHGYPFPLVAVQYSGYFTDNSPPCLKESELIREWNEKYEYPKLRSATMGEFMAGIEKNHAAELPVWKAAYPDWWTDGFGSAARETAASRTTQSDIGAAEGMFSMSVMSGHDQIPGLSGETGRIYENLLFYDEHTFGAAESIRDPLCENSQVQWAEKGSYVWEALKSTKMLGEAAAGMFYDDLYRGKKPTVTFFNPCGWERSGLVKFYADYEMIPADRDFALVDENGDRLRCQPLNSRSEGRYYAVWAENIPSFGYKTYEIELLGGLQTPDIRKMPEDGIIENDWYKIGFDPSRGSILSLYDKELSRELADTAAVWNIGDFIYESLEGDRAQMEAKRFDTYSRHALENVRCEGVAEGAVYNTISFVGESQGCDTSDGVRIEVRMYNHEKLLEFCYSAVRLPETDPAGIYVAFPFSLESSDHYFDVPGGVVRHAGNQIPRSSAAWNTVQNFAGVRNSSCQILVSTGQIPLFMMGELLNDPYRPDHRIDNGHIYSWVMNNYWTTNFRASQEGELNWSYLITSEAGDRDSDAMRFGIGNRTPMPVRVMPPAPADNGRSRERSFLHTEADNIVMISAHPSEVYDNSVVCNFREMDGRETELVILDSSGNAIPFEIVNICEEPAEGQKDGTMDRPTTDRHVKMDPDVKMNRHVNLDKSIKLQPYQNVFVRLHSAVKD